MKMKINEIKLKKNFKLPVSAGLMYTYMLYDRAVKFTSHNMQNVIWAATDAAKQCGSSVNENDMDAICVNFGE